MGAKYEICNTQSAPPPTVNSSASLDVDQDDVQGIEEKETIIA
jgi:hypothetical protein